MFTKSIQYCPLLLPMHSLFQDSLDQCRRVWSKGLAKRTMASPVRPRCPPSHEKCPCVSAQCSRGKSALHFRLGLPHYKILDQPLNAQCDQCRSKFWHWSQCRSVPINSDWEEFWINARILIDMDRHWALIEGVLLLQKLQTTLTVLNNPDRQVCLCWAFALVSW